MKKLIDKNMRFQDWVATFGWGGQTSVSLLIGVRSQTVNNWLKFNRSPSPKFRNKIRKLSNNQVDFSLFDKEFEAHQEVDCPC